MCGILNVCSSWQLYTRAWAKVLLIPSLVTLPRLCMELLLGQWTEPLFPPILSCGDTPSCFLVPLFASPSSVRCTQSTSLETSAFRIRYSSTRNQHFSWWLLRTWLLIGFGHKETSMVIATVLARVLMHALGESLSYCICLHIYADPLFTKWGIGKCGGQFIVGITFPNYEHFHSSVRQRTGLVNMYS